MGHDGAYLRARRKAALSSAPGNRRGTKSQSPWRSPRLSPSTGLDLVSTRSNHGHTLFREFFCHVRPTIVSVDDTLEPPFTRQLRAPLLSMRCNHSESARMGPTLSGPGGGRFPRLLECHCSPRQVLVGMLSRFCEPHPGPGCGPPEVGQVHWTKLPRLRVPIPPRPNRLRQFSGCVPSMGVQVSERHA